MKRALLMILLLFILFLGNSASISLRWVDPLPGSDAYPYVFPVYSDDPEWLELPGTPERERMCQVPEIKLVSMTTRALVETALDMPFFRVYSAYNTKEQACMAMRERFNVFPALLSREDLTEVLLEVYESAAVMTAEEYEQSPMDHTSIRKFFHTSDIEFLFVCDWLVSGPYSLEEYDRLSALLDEKEAERLETGLYSIHSSIFRRFEEETQIRGNNA